MATFRLTAPWVPSGPGGGTVLPVGTLVGDGTAYPIKDAKGMERPPAASEKVPTPPPGKPGNAEQADPGPDVIDPSKPYVAPEAKKLGIKLAGEEEPPPDKPPPADKGGKK